MTSTLFKRDMASIYGWKLVCYLSIVLLSLSLLRAVKGEKGVFDPRSSFCWFCCFSVQSMSVNKNECERERNKSIRSSTSVSVCCFWGLWELIIGRTKTAHPNAMLHNDRAFKTALKSEACLTTPHPGPSTLCHSSHQPT